MEKVSVGTYQAIIRLGGHAELLFLEVGILTSYGLECLAVFVVGRQVCLVVDIKGKDNIIVAQDIEHTRIAPHVSLHLAAVDTSVACEIQENRLIQRFCTFHSLIVVEIAIQSVRKFKQIAIKRRLA